MWKKRVRVRQRERYLCTCLHVALTSQSSQLPALIAPEGNLFEGAWWSTALTWTYSSESWQSPSSSLPRLSGEWSGVEELRGWRRCEWWWWWWQQQGWMGGRQIRPLKNSWKCCFLQNDLIWNLSTLSLNWFSLILDFTNSFICLFSHLGSASFLLYSILFSNVPSSLSLWLTII